MQKVVNTLRSKDSNSSPLSCTPSCPRPCPWSWAPGTVTYGESTQVRKWIQHCGMHAALGLAPGQCAAALQPLSLTRGRFGVAVSLAPVMIWRHYFPQDALKRFTSRNGESFLDFLDELDAKPAKAYLTQTFDAVLSRPGSAHRIGGTAALRQCVPAYLRLLHRSRRAGIPDVKPIIAVFEEMVPAMERAVTDTPEDIPVVQGFSELERVYNEYGLKWLNGVSLEWFR